MPSTFLFAYGSLLFRPIPFPGIVSRVGFVNSLRRRFAQFSHDHRGTPSCPGVVVTLVTAHDWALHSEGDDEFEEMPIWGRIYEIPEEGARAVWDYLDHREKDGYTLEKVDVFDRVGTEELLIQKDCCVYVGQVSNPSFAGGIHLPLLAEQIATSVGPSGPNKEYLYNLTAAIRLLSPFAQDPYLVALEALVRQHAGDLVPPLVIVSSL